MLHETEILAAIRKLRNNMTSGLDGIPAFFVKDCSVIFAPILTFVYNLALSTSTFWGAARPECVQFSRRAPSVI